MGNKIRRWQRVVPGFVCPDDHPQCVGKHEGRQHGQHGDEWHYGVSVGDVGLTLYVYTDLYRGQHTRLGKPWTRGMPATMQDCVYGTDLSWHTAFPTSKEALLAEPHDGCEVIDGDACWVADSSGLNARDFFRDHGSPDGSDQPATLWRAMEAKLLGRVEGLRAADARKTHRVCPTCGRGVLPRALTRTRSASAKAKTARKRADGMARRQA